MTQLAQIYQKHKKRTILFLLAFLVLFALGTVLCFHYLFSENFLDYCLGKNNDFFAILTMWLVIITGLLSFFEVALIVFSVPLICTLLLSGTAAIKEFDANRMINKSLEKQAELENQEIYHQFSDSLSQNSKNFLWFSALIISENTIPLDFLYSLLDDQAEATLKEILQTPLFCLVDKEMQEVFSESKGISLLYTNISTHQKKTNGVPALLKFDPKILKFASSTPLISEEMIVRAFTNYQGEKNLLFLKRLERAYSKMKRRETKILIAKLASQVNLKLEHFEASRCWNREILKINEDIN